MLAWSILSGTRRLSFDYLALTKPGIASLVALTALAGLWLAAGGPPPHDLLIPTLLGTGLASGSAAVFNNVLDRDLDARMTRTRRRPLPAGRVKPGEALCFALALGASALLILVLFVNLLSALLAAFAALFYTSLYTAWLKRTTPWCAVLGGVPGALPPVIGWTAVTQNIDAGALALFALLFLWQPPHFWALALLRRDDYERARCPVLPVACGPQTARRWILIYTVGLLPISLLPYLLEVVRLGYAVTAVVLGLGFVGLALWLRSIPDDDERLAGGLFRYSILYLGALVVALLLDCAC